MSRPSRDQDGRMLPRRLARLAAHLAPVVLLLPAAAHAETVVVEDATGDAQAFDYGFELLAAPQEASVDITRTVGSFGHRRLKVTVHFRDLEKRVRHDVRLRIRTPRSTFDVRAGRRSAAPATVAIRERGAAALECGGLRVAYDGLGDTVSLSVPATCIDSPRWVRLGVKAKATSRVDGENPSTVLYLADDGHRGGFRENSIGHGPRIRRG